MTHTPGPWENIGHYGNYQSEIDGMGHAVATVWTKRPGAHNSNEFKESSVISWAEGEANARLITAAPDLLAALEELTDLVQGMIDGTYTPDSFTLQPARTILAKVRGE